MFIKYAPSGWSTEEIIIEYIGWLQNQVHSAPFVLIFDVYPAHDSLRVKQFAEENNIEILYVPAGGTSKYQPLDYRIFGKLKARARNRFQDFVINNLFADGTYEEALDIIEECWELIPEDHIHKAWQIK
jgi:hypothetical protein